jgi:diguanylate cyclase (GGDEF)-like protein
MKIDTLNILLRSITDKERRNVMALIILLASMLFAGIWVISSLNLDFSQRIMSDVRSEQIDELYRSGWERITSKQQSLELHTATLAHIGERYYRLAYESKTSVADRQRLWRELSRSLAEHLNEYHDSSGMAIWFEPGIFAERSQSASIQYQLIDGKLVLTEGTSDQNYINMSWYQRLTEINDIEHEDLKHPISWSAVYFDLQAKRAQFTVSTPMFNSQKQLIGRVTTDWAANEVIKLVGDTQITENSFSFLVDKNNRKLTSLSQFEQSKTSQMIIDAVIELNLPSRESKRKTDNEIPLSQLQIEVGSRQYELIHGETRSGMVYGVGVPSDEIDAVLEPLRLTNLSILIIMGLLLIFLSMGIIWKIYQLMQALQAAHKDAVTGLYNRSELFDRAMLENNTGLILLNIDGFKEVNALFGQTCGDKILESVARELESQLTNLSSSSNSTVYRLPGDEFLLRLKAKSDSFLTIAAESIVKDVSKLNIQWQEQTLHVDLSAGVSFIEKPGSDMDIETLLGQAALALEHGREKGVRICLYTEQLSKEATYEHNLFWASELKRALASDQLIPFYQPIYSNQDNKVSKYECLLRMQDESGEFISPEIFLEIAHKLKLERRLTGLMIQKCFAKFSTLPYEFSINLDYADISDDNTVELIIEHLKNTKAGPRVIFEILESDGIENYEQVMKFIEQVRPYGARIAIDDFGTGYSNFEHLLRLKVDIIKIDGSLVKVIDKDKSAYLIVEGLVSFAKRLGIQVVAEFVHNETIQQKVKTLGIDFSQGSYFGMPDKDIVQ